MIKIIKILNNNAFISVDSTGEEVIVMGVGIAFGKKNDQDVEPVGRYKVFSNKDSNLNDRFKAVFSDISEEYLEVTERIIYLMETDYNKQVSDIVYVTLAEHIQGAIEREKKGVVLKNPLLMEIRRLFKDEFEVGLQALNEIERAFGVKFPDDEAAYIAQHLVNGQLDNLVDINDISQFMQEIIDIIKYSYRIEFNEDSIYYHRFVTHLKFFAQRVIDNQKYQSESEDIFEVFKTKYVTSYECVVKIKNFLENIYNYSINTDEQLYLLLHIEKITKNARIN